MRKPTTSATMVAHGLFLVGTTLLIFGDQVIAHFCSPPCGWYLSALYVTNEPRLLLGTFSLYQPGTLYQPGSGPLDDTYNVTFDLETNEMIHPIDQDRYDELLPQGDTLSSLKVTKRDNPAFHQGLNLAWESFPANITDGNTTFTLINPVTEEPFDLDFNPSRIPRPPEYFVDNGHAYIFTPFYNGEVVYILNISAGTLEYVALRPHYAHDFHDAYSNGQPLELYPDIGIVKLHFPFAPPCGMIGYINYKRAILSLFVPQTFIDPIPQPTPIFQDDHYLTFLVLEGQVEINEVSWETGESVRTWTFVPPLVEESVQVCQTDTLGPDTVAPSVESSVGSLSWLVSMVVIPPLWMSLFLLGCSIP